jgi:hypothetical protein
MNKMKTNLVTTIVTLSILTSMLSTGLIIPLAYSGSISIPIDQAISFQNEGTLQYDDTTKLLIDDGIYGPTITGSVFEDQYISGNSVLWFDAISVHFDLTGISGSLNDYSIKLIIDLQKGDYFRNNWQHYIILQGDQNNAYENGGPPGLAVEFAETEVPSGTLILLEVQVAPSMIVNGWVTIRLWNARVDYVELELTERTLVDIDIKPGSFPNSINLASKGVVPVALLGDEDFDAANVDPVTLDFAGAIPLRWTLEDANLDGWLDLVVFFKTRELSLTVGDVEATLIGDTFEGIPIIGTDSVNIVPKD